MENSHTPEDGGEVLENEKNVPSDSLGVTR